MLHAHRISPEDVTQAGLRFRCFQSKNLHGLLIAATRLTLGIHCTLATECAKIRPNRAGDASPNC